jgi:hypothetical protein
MITTSRLRQWHAYIGLFIAPSVLFFAVTGALQIFNLHEAHDGYRPAVLLEKLSAIHKDQVFEQPHEHEEQAAAAPAGDAAQHAAAQQPADDDDKLSASTLALKWLFLFVAVGLTLSTSIGIWMGITQLRRPALAWILIAAGVAAPVLLLAI